MANTFLFLSIALIVATILVRTAYATLTFAYGNRSSWRFVLRVLDTSSIILLITWSVVTAVALVLLLSEPAA